MAAGPNDALRALIDQLSPAQARDTLAYAQRRQHRHEPVQPSAPPHELPALHRAPAITSAEELVVPLCSPDDDADECAATVRRWREIPARA